MDDSTIKIRVRNNPEAFSEVIDEYSEKLSRYIQRSSNLDEYEVDSLLQDIFVKTYRYINEYDDRYSFSSWIYRIAHNMIIDSYRRSKSRPEKISIDDEDYISIINSLTDWANPHDDSISKDKRECVRTAISKLRKDYREVITLKCLEGCSFKDISDILKIPVWTASTLVNRARAELKTIISDLHCNN